MTHFAILFLYMIELPHTIIGATIATKMGNPALSLPIAFLSHFILDLLPHWNPGIYKELNHKSEVSKRSKKIILADCLAALLIGTLLALRFHPNLGKVATIMAACFLAVLPDLAEAPYFFAGSRNKYLLAYINLHRRFQGNGPFWLGISTQIVIIVICLFLILS